MFSFYLPYVSFVLCVLIPFISPSFGIFPKHLYSTPKTKTIREKNLKRKKVNFIMEATVWLKKSHYKPLHPNICGCKCSWQSFICLVPGLWFLWYYQFWALTRTLFGYPVVSLCCGDSVALDLVLSHALADYGWGGYWGRPKHKPGFGPGHL